MSGEHGLKDWVALTLAIGICTAVNSVTFAVLYDAIFSRGPGLSDNATQVLTTAFGGIIGVLGAYLGFRAGQASTAAADSWGAAPYMPPEQNEPPAG